MNVAMVLTPDDGEHERLTISVLLPKPAPRGAWLKFSCVMKLDEAGTSTIGNIVLMPDDAASVERAEMSALFEGKNHD